MLLVDAKVSGYRRFGSDTQHKLLVDSKLACLIGSNEAGKSSLLRVISEAYDATAIPSMDRTRLEAVPDNHVVVSLRFRLDADDCAAVRSFYGNSAPEPRWFVVKKTAGGALTINPDLKAKRSRAVRAAARDAITDSSLYSSSVLIATDSDSPGHAEALAFTGEARAAVDQITDEPSTLDGAALTAVEAVAVQLRSAGDEAAAKVLDDLVASERQEHPATTVANTLWNRTPDFVLFGVDERSLQSEYDLTAVATDPPAALRNLAQLADLDLVALRALIASNETGTIRYRIDEANQRLRVAFARWSQKPPVHVMFETSATQLLVHVRSGDDLPMRFDERSDGLRQFVALVAATAQTARSGPPILLIDEVETHLHYDAQVDLVRLLAEQDAVSQVIYTTHSAACLPDDLGSVRMIEPDPNRTRSRIRQQFWSDEPGLGPLLMAMGAASLAFVPRRAAIIAEGASELLLLPTLIREAIGREDLGYQVAPGAATVRPTAIIGFDLEAPHTLWLVDGDKGGMGHRETLMEHGIQTDHVLILGGASSGVSLEDLVEAEVLADAVTGHARDVGIHETFDADLSAGVDRNRAIADWFASHGRDAPSKVVIANRLLSMRAERTLIADEHRATVTAIHTAAAAAFGVKLTGS